MIINWNVAAGRVVVVRPACSMIVFACWKETVADYRFRSFTEIVKTQVSPEFCDINAVFIAVFH